MTREQFEALVRAEAEKEYPDRVLDNGVYRATELQFHNEHHTYIATRMEHEWPLVEALQGLVDSVSYVDPGVYELDLAKAALSPYAAKPIER